MFNSRKYQGIRGTNKPLEEALDEVFKQSITIDGQSYPVLPDTDLKEFLAKYFAEMEKVSD